MERKLISSSLWHIAGLGRSHVFPNCSKEQYSIEFLHFFHERHKECNQLRQMLSRAAHFWSASGSLNADKLLQFVAFCSKANTSQKYGDDAKCGATCLADWVSGLISSRCSCYCLSPLQVGSHAEQIHDFCSATSDFRQKKTSSLPSIFVLTRFHFFFYFSRIVFRRLLQFALLFYASCFHFFYFTFIVLVISLLLSCTWADLEVYAPPK